MVEPTVKPAAVLLLFLLHSCVADHVFLNSQRASQVLVRNRRANQLFEELKPGNLERECVEETCSHEEVQEVFEERDKMETFWARYLGHCIFGHGVNYDGDVHVTQSGRTCQHWTDNFPHPIYREFSASGPNSILKENFCRNPDKRPEGPWCFTQDPTVQKETCRVPICGEDFVPPSVATEPAKTVECLLKYGTEYVGNLSVTLGGHTCLPWSSPQVRVLSQDKGFIPEVDLQSNKCRNPDNDPEGPWCYVNISGNITVDYCNLELCEDPLFEPDQTTVTEERQRSFLSEKIKRFFNPRTFGQGEDDCGWRPLFENINRLDGKEGELMEARENRMLQDNVQVGSAPWHVMLYKHSPKELLCGASLISDQWILTAAHCILYPPWNKNFSTNELQVRLGKRNRVMFEQSAEKTVDIDEIIVHPKYDWRTNLNHDVALLHMRKPIEFTNEIHPICLPSKKVAQTLLSEGYKGRVTGWGIMKKIWNPAVTNLPTILQQIHLPIVDQDICPRSTSVRITDNVFCAGFAESFQNGDVCMGDNGGPFAMKYPAENRWYQIGIVSWGEGCDRDGKYGFYTHLFRMRRWMRKVIEKSEGSDDE